MSMLLFLVSLPSARWVLRSKKVSTNLQSHCGGIYECLQHVAPSFLELSSDGLNVNHQASIDASIGINAIEKPSC